MYGKGFQCHSSPLAATVSLRKPEIIAQFEPNPKIRLGAILKKNWEEPNGSVNAANILSVS